MADGKKGGVAAKVEGAAEAAVETVETAVETAVEAVEHVLSEAEQRATDLVHNWRAEHLTNNAFSQDTGAWNVLHEKLSHLIRAIVEEIG